MPVGPSALMRLAAQPAYFVFRYKPGTYPLGFIKAPKNPIVKGDQFLKQSGGGVSLNSHCLPSPEIFFLRCLLSGMRIPSRNSRRVWLNLMRPSGSPYPR
ncbi:hypothetical protein NPIL_146311 [Nephila pilipes]|uniref:Uncharacterized protein n=1 Tax=Nephila pilipes TaxID=299642 RepID=A0A8X6Q4E3_NEPPI|nr:hypothetical protein NPIL_146311 [Nephila pilipes]